MKSIKTKIMTLTIIVILVACVGVGLISYKISSQQLTSNVKDQLRELSDQGANNINAHLKTEWSTLEALALNDTLRDPDVALSEKNKFLQREVERVGAVNVSFANADGDTLAPDGTTLVNVKERGYFQSAMQGTPAVSDPIENKTDPGTMIVVYAIPVKNDNTIIGVLFKIMDGNALSEVTNSLQFGKTGKAYMINNAGTTIAHFDSESVLRADNMLEKAKTDKTFQGFSDLYNQIFKEKNGTGSYTYNNVYKLVGYAPVEDTNWFVVVSVPKNEILAGLDTMKVMIPLCALILLVICSIFSFILAGLIVKPIKVITSNLNKIASGDLSEHISEKHLKNRDETGSLANALLTMQSSMKDLITTIQYESSNIESSASLEENNMVDLLKEIEDVAATTQELAAGSQETAASSEEMNATSTEVMQEISSIAQRAQEGSTTATEISIRAKDLKEIALTSKTAAMKIYNESEGILKKAIEQSKGVEQINALTGAILGITSQTNLLALNASIEAARAGEAGKGFAVVAEEIRKLAENSNQTITEIQTVTKNVVESVENLSKSSEKLLYFMDEKVIADYDRFVSTSEQYNEDAIFVDGFVTDLSATTEEVAASMENMIKAIDEITISTNEAASGASIIAEKTANITGKANEALEIAGQTSTISTKLVNAIDKYNI
ncbi:MAG: cache domain-containing protein [Velocimicrobium sp.]